jgi:hypothetical protein
MTAISSSLKTLNQSSQTQVEVRVVLTHKLEVLSPNDDQVIAPFLIILLRVANRLALASDSIASQGPSSTRSMSQWQSTGDESAPTEPFLTGTP